MDEWGAGSYEDTAAELEPVADAAVAALALTGDERVLDVACGTGNAALVARDAGARVSGVDSSPRLIDVARERVPDAELVVGDASALPFADAAFDAAVSVFGAIFARPAEQAVAELARVVRPGGRIVITSWPPRGPVFAAISLMRRALARVRPPEGPPGADWGDPAVVERLLAPHGEVSVTERELVAEELTPAQVWDRWERTHPMWIGARRLLEPAGEWEALREDSLAALREGLPADGAAVSPYWLAVVERR